MRLSTYILKRTGYIVFSLIGLSILVFALARVLPGDPARMAAGPRASESVVEQIRKQLRFDRPIYEQYFYWVNDLLHGDLGYSLVTRRSITTDVLEYLPVSLELIFLAAVFEVAGAFLLGVIAGRYSYKWPDNIVRVFPYVGISIPVFVMAIVFQLLFTWNIKIFPTSGMLSQGLERPPVVTGMVTLDSLIAGRLTCSGMFYGTWCSRPWHCAWEECCRTPELYDLEWSRTKIRITYLWPLLRVCLKGK